MLTCNRSNFYIILCSCRLRLTRRVPLVVHELQAIPEHLSSPPNFSGIRVVFCGSLFVLFFLFLWHLNCLSFFALSTILVPSNFDNIIYNYTSEWKICFQTRSNNVPKFDHHVLLKHSELEFWSRSKVVEFYHAIPFVNKYSCQ